MSLAATSKGAARRRALILTAAAAIVVVVALIGGVGGAGATSLTLCGTTIGAPTANPSTTTAGQPITYTATVTAAPGCANGNPTGTVGFYTNFDVGGQPTTFLIGSQATLQPVPGTTNQSIATLTDNTLPAGGYAITASYTSNSPLFFYSGPSGGTQVVVQGVDLHPTAMTFTGSPLTIQTGQSVTFTVTVTALDGGATPTGNIIFTAGSSQSPELQGTIGTATLINGTATFQFGAFGPAGTYYVIASYPGNAVDHTVSGELSILVTPSSNPPIATTTTVSATSATMSAHVVETATGTPPPAGAAVDFSVGTSLNGLTPSGVGSIDANGNVTLPTPGLGPGTYYVRAEYTGDLRDANNPISPSNDTTTLVIAGGSGGGTFATQLTYTGATEAAYGAQATLAAHLTGAGGPLGLQPVTLGMGSQQCSGATNNAGDVSCQITVSQDAGVHPVSAQFAGSGVWTASSATSSFTVDPLPTAIDYTGDTAGAFGSPATLSAHLATGGAGLGGKHVALYVDGQSCTGTTDASGAVACAVILNEAPGTYPLEASFIGDTNYLASQATGTFTVTPAHTTTTYTGATQGTQGTSATLSAHVATAPDGEPVALTLGSQHCTGTTAGGDASCTVTLTDAPGTGYTVTATYGGDVSHLGSADSKPFTILSPATTTHAGPVAPVLAGTAATLTATVAPAAATGSVTFSTGGATLCTGTLSGGAASCSATFAEPGSYTVIARYAGAGVYPPSSDTTTVLVYALAPGGGTFVAGDKSASGTITFWGAQWSKLNALGGGPAPSAFKGFAVSSSTPACGATWSTDPGNSSPPPAGPLPAYMAVIVTSKATKHGSQISGDTVAVVIVRTNAGYRGDPGHAGTGTVVATLCG